MDATGDAWSRGQVRLGRVLHEVQEREAVSLEWRCAQSAGSAWASSVQPQPPAVPIRVDTYMINKNVKELNI